MIADVREKLWLWCHQAGSHDGRYGLPSPSDATPAEAADELGLDNAIMVCFSGEPQPPLAPHAEPLRSLDCLVWSLIGDSSSKRNDEETDLEAVIELAAECPNLVGAIMDDFFIPPARQAELGLARYTVAEVGSFRERLQSCSPPLDLWVVMYDYLMASPVESHLAQCDVITFWNWETDSIPQLETNLQRLQAMAPMQQKLLGCYMWDYGGNRPMPLDLMQQQCEIGLTWLRDGRLDGMVFLGSNLCGLDLEAVAWTRDWIDRVSAPPV